MRKVIASVVFSFLTASVVTGCGNIESFTPEVNVSQEVLSSSGPLIYPVTRENNNAGISRIIQRKNGEFVLVYASEKSGDKNIYLTTSRDGKNWRVPEKVTDGDLSETSPAIIEDEKGILRLFYSSNQNGDWEIFQTTSSDAMQWTAENKVALDYQGVLNPNISHGKNGEIILSYETFGSGLFAAKSTDGIKWQQFMVSDQGENASVQYLDGKYFTVYENDHRLFIKNSENLYDWTEPSLIEAEEEAREPFLSKNDKGLLLTFSSQTMDGKWDIHLKQFDLASGKWESSRQITNNSLHNLKPNAFINNNLSMVSWTVENRESISNNRAIFVTMGI